LRQIAHLAGSLRAWVAANLVVAALLGAITVGGGVLRAEQAANPSARQSVDERAYGRLARGLARNFRYDSPVMDDPVRWPPGAPFVFAFAHKLHPVYETPERWDVPAAYPFQWVFSTATIPAVFVLALLLGGPVAGLLAAAGVAFYPPLIESAGELLTEPLGALLLTGALIAVVLALRRRTWRWAAGAGLLLGLMVLTRADLLALPAVFVVLLGIVAWRADGLRRGAVLAAVMAAGILVTTGPWSAYASHVTGKPTPVSSGGASNLFVGTYLPGNGSMFGLKKALGDETRAWHAQFRDLSNTQLPQRVIISYVAAQHPELDREAALREAAMDNIRDYLIGDPVGFAGMSWGKVERLWGNYTVGTSKAREGWITALHLVLVLVAAAGLLAGLVRGPRRVELLVVALVVLYVTAINIALVSEARHNLPIVPVLLAGGFAGLALALRGVRAPRRGGDREPAAA
jgi:4-amino-4-deoxy-L-arabinose transferase-like glycosyltransferase